MPSTLTLTLTKEHPQGYLSCEEGPLYTTSIHTIATRAASLSSSRSLRGHRYRSRQPIEVTSWWSLLLDT